MFRSMMMGTLAFALLLAGVRDAAALGKKARKAAKPAAAPAAKTFAKEHPRRAEVLKRERHQVKQTNRAEATKQLTHQQASHIKSEDRAIKRQEQQMARLNGGHITKGEQKVLNQEENKVHREIGHDERLDRSGAKNTGGQLGLPTTRPSKPGEFAEDHPRRAQVIRRDEHQIDVAQRGQATGKLTADQASKIIGEDRNIRRQEQEMAQVNGHHITPGEQRVLNQEENKVHREIVRDEKGNAVPPPVAVAPATPAVPPAVPVVTPQAQ